MTDTPFNVFISYSRKDEILKDELLVHLASLERDGDITPWQDRDIEGGEVWSDEIRNALEAAHIVLLLITPRFLASRYCFDEEMKEAMNRHEDGKARVVPIIMKPCDWQTSPFSKLQVLPKDALPVTRWDDQDEALLDVVKGLRRIVKSLRQQAASQSSNVASTQPTSAEASSSAPSSSQGAASSGRSRLALIRLLSDLPPTQFEELMFGLNVPAKNRPSSALPQGQRASELLNWAESPVGCTLPVLEATLDEILNP